MKNCRKGFTLAELLIVVAIIAVLVAVAIPIFASQLERSREATDLANVRSAYAEVMTAAVADDLSSNVYDSFYDEFISIVFLNQKEDGWKMSESTLNIGGVTPADSVHWQGNAKAGGRCKVVYSRKKQDITLIWDGYTVYPDFQWRKYKVNDVEYLVTDNVSFLPDSWPAASIPEFFETKNGTQTLVVDEITATDYPTLSDWLTKGGGYEIGYFITKPETGEILFDSKGIYIDKSKSNLNFEIKTDKIADGADVNIAIQFFKMKDDEIHGQGSVKMTDEEARELSRIFRFVDKTSN